MVRATTCQGVTFLLNMRDMKRTTGGPWLSPLSGCCQWAGNGRRVGGRGVRELLPDQVGRPKGQHGHDLQSPRLDRRPAQQMVNHVGGWSVMVGCLCAAGGGHVCTREASSSMGRGGEFGGQRAGRAAGGPGEIIRWKSALAPDRWEHGRRSRVPGRDGWTEGCADRGASGPR